MSKKVLSIKAKFGEACYAVWGKMGYDATCAKYFAGDKAAMNDWLTRTGRWSQDCHLSYHKPEIYGYPGDHPAKVSRELALVEYASRNITGLFEAIGDK